VFADFWEEEALMTRRATAKASREDEADLPRPRGPPLSTGDVLLFCSSHSCLFFISSTVGSCSQVYREPLSTVLIERYICSWLRLESFLNKGANSWAGRL